MALDGKLTFQQTTAFHGELRRRVDAYFSERNLSKAANGAMVAKTIFWLAWTWGAVALTVAQVVPYPYAWLLWAAQGFGFACIGFNIGHDAIHGSYSEKPWVNRALSWAFDVMGASSYTWSVAHNIVHHTYTNIPGVDDDLEPGPTMVFYPQPTRWFHRFQHLYAPFIFWLVDVHTVFYQDIVYLMKKRLANMTDIRHPVHEYVLFVVCKLAYLAIVAGVPIMVLDVPWWQVVLGAAIMSFVASVLFVTLLIGTHFAEETQFPQFDQDGYIGHDWAEHALVTSVDWSPENRLALFIAGGANCHAAHHLFPTVCHIHYIPITRIIRQTAAEFGLAYNCTTLPRLVHSHFRFLKRMGRRASPAAA